LRVDVIKRALISGVPSFVIYLMMRRFGIAQARTVAFASIVATQLAQTLDLGRSESHLTRSVSGAVAGSAAVLLAALTVPTVRNFLNLAVLSPFGWQLIGAGALTAWGLSRVFSSSLLKVARRSAIDSTQFRHSHHKCIGLVCKP
jgi:Cation transporting ATPase, C-terminus